MRYSITRDWLGQKLNVNPGELQLFIESNFSSYVNRPEKEKMALADSVEYIHSRLGMIIFGPKTIHVEHGITINLGYESREFQDFVKNRSSSV